MKIGIFWYHDKTVTGYAHEFSVNDQDALGMVESPYQHIDYWEVLKTKQPDLKYINDDNIPKGRVMFNTSTGKILIQLNEELCKKTIIKKVADYFQVGINDLVWESSSSFIY